MGYGLTTNFTTDFSFDFPWWITAILIAGGIVLALLLARKIIKRLFYRRAFFDQTIYLVRLPKERPGDEEKDFTLERLREEIARGETIFSSIGGLRAQKGFLPWLLGRDDHFSFEIVASRKTISFYLVAPKKMSRYLEQQVQAHYPEASLEEAEDYNIFNPQGGIAAAYLRTKRNFILPIKTFNKMEGDPLNSLVNVLSKLGPDEGLAAQFVVRSARAAWHKKAAEAARGLSAGKTIEEVVKKSAGSAFFSFLGGLVKAAKPSAAEDRKEPRRLTAMEEEIMKLIEEKNAKAGLDVNVRLVASAANKGQAKIYLANLTSAFSQYDYYQYGNGFRGGTFFQSERGIVNDFIYRRFNERVGFLLNTEELTSLFHFPLRQAETPNILWLTAKRAAAPSSLPEEGIILGENIYRGVEREVKIKREDRRRHTYIIGKSGVGKSVLLANMAIQDIQNGEGVCIIDPHGDLIEDVINRVPPERAEDVILFSPADIERPLGLNLLEYDRKYPEQKTFVINEMIKIFDKLYDLKATGGPIFEQYMRNSMLLIMSSLESGATLMEIPKVLADAKFRRAKLEKCLDPTVVDFWRQEAEKAGGEAALANVVPYITSKLTSFISNDTMRPIIGQTKSSFNLREVMDRRQILLVDLSKGQVGEMNAYLLGMILVGKILMAALSRTDLPREQRKDFYLYIDEFQNFTTDSICSILSEARKYGLNLIIAHQYLGQLTLRGGDNSVRDAVFGNVGTWIVFQIGTEDAEVMAKEFSPVFNQYDLINIEKYTAYIRLLIDNTVSRPFSLSSLPLAGARKEETGGRIRSLSRYKYGRDRTVVEAEISARARETRGEE